MTMKEHTKFSSSLSTPIKSFFLNFSYPSRSEICLSVVLICIILMADDSEQVFISWDSVYLLCTSILIFCSFYLWIFCFFVSFCTVLLYSRYKPLTRYNIYKYLSHSLSCIFTTKWYLLDKKFLNSHEV